MYKIAMHDAPYLKVIGFVVLKHSVTHAFVSFHHVGLSRQYSLLVATVRISSEKLCLSGFGESSFSTEFSEQIFMSK